jgi:hypothetical protein
MPLVLLRRHAPEAQSAGTCSLCGASLWDATKDHLLVGTPGTPSHDGAVCEACGSALEQIVSKFGRELTVTVEEAQRQASDREISLPEH